MSRSIARARAGRDRTRLYHEITDKIITELEAGRVTWGTVAAQAPLTMPKIAETQQMVARVVQRGRRADGARTRFNRHCSGINVLILWGALIDWGLSTQNWLTFRQAVGGGNVRKGGRGTTLLHTDHFLPNKERRRSECDGDANAIRFLKRFMVFNTDQCEDLVRQVHIARILSSESTTYRLDQAILFIASDALGHDALQKAILRTRRIDHWLASDFDGTIMFGEADAVQHAARENSECRAHDNLNTIPQAASIGDKTAA
jgi:antirestriction protein ArdC